MRCGGWPDIQIMFQTQREFPVSFHCSDDHVVVLKGRFTIDQLRLAVRQVFGSQREGTVRSMVAASRRRTCMLFSIVYK
jgi:hypothetical protein